MKLSILALPLLAFAQLARRDDTDGGGDPQAGGSSNNNPKLTNWLNKPGQQPQVPSRDNFYRKIPSDLSKYKSGQIIEKRNMSLSGTYAGIDNAYQVKIRTEDAHNAAAVSFASVLIPRSSRASGNIVVYQLPEDALSIDCAPTYQLFGKNAIPEIQALIGQGHVVVVPDYEGTRGSYTVGRLGGKHILDSARASLNLPNVKLANLTTSVGLWGYGTGAHSTGWAIELASSYAPELPLKGVAVGGFITDLVDWLDNINNTPFAGNLVASLLGMATEYKDVDDALQDDVIPRRRQQFDAAASRCAWENELHFFNANITSQYFTPGVDLLSDEKVRNVYDLNALGKNAPCTSLFVYHGGSDQQVSQHTLQSTLNSYCKLGAKVKYTEYTDESHFQARSHYSDVLEYFRSVFGGKEVENSCSHFGESN